VSKEIREKALQILEGFGVRHPIFINMSCSKGYIVFLLTFYVDNTKVPI
jgi:hypothetical protein